LLGGLKFEGAATRRVEVADEEMVWVYWGWSDARCPICEGDMVNGELGAGCTSCGWPNDKVKTEPTICELIAANNLKHRVIPTMGRGA
jgi:hypothetical protein